MKSTRASSNPACYPEDNLEGMELSLTGLPLLVSRRPNSASPAKPIARSVSVITENKPRRNALESTGLGSSRAINNLRRSNSTTQVNQQLNGTLSTDQPTDFLTFFDSSTGGRKKLAGLCKTSPEKRTTWNILDDQPRVFTIPSSARSTNTADSSVGLRKKEGTISLAPNFTANNRSNKGAVGNCVTTMVHNNYSTIDKIPPPKSSNQAASSLNNIIKATANEDGESGSFMKPQKNLSSNNNVTRNNTSGAAGLLRRKEVTEEEAERFIHQVNLAAVTIQRWYRHHAQRHRTGASLLEHLLTSKRKERQQKQLEGNVLDLEPRKDLERKKIREEKARQARQAAIQELQQKRAAQKAGDIALGQPKETRKASKKRPIQAASPKSGSLADRTVKANNTGANFHATDPEEYFHPVPDSSAALCKSPEDKPQDITCHEVVCESLDTAVTASSRPQAKVTLNELLETLKLLEEEPEQLNQPKTYKKEKYSWIDGEVGSNSLTADNLEKFGKLNPPHGVPEDGALLSEAKLQSIMSFLDEMEKSEQERPHSVASAPLREGILTEEELAHLEQASAVATEVTSSMMRLKLEVEEKKQAMTLLQTALAQQRELTVRNVKETEKELTQQLRTQREQYEAAIQRHLAFIDQLIDDKKVLSEKCEAVVAELKQVDQKYTKRITQVQEQHELIKKLKELMSATEKIRREKWINEKTKKIKEITVRGLEPEIQKLIAKHKQEIKKLKTLHEAELLQSDQRAAQRYVQQTEELREHLEREKEEQGRRERELARQRYEKHLEEEEQALQQQRRRLYSEVAEEKERLNQQAARQRAELEKLKQQLEENSCVVTRALREEYEKGREEQERRHQLDMKALKERLEVEKEAWEANYLKKEEAWLLKRERELKDEVRKVRDKEIELVIQRLEADMTLTKEECEQTAENRIKRVRDKYEAELADLEQSERKLQERCAELKGRLGEAEGENSRLQGLVKRKEKEVEDVIMVKDKLMEERSSLSEVIRQEFSDRLKATEEENRRLKVEISELRTRQQLELEKVNRDKEDELEEVHKRVKMAIMKKEETVNSLRKQYEAAVKRADHLEALLEQQRKQLLSVK
ncbi:centrosomal protein of 131 kDa isoform X2 [Trichosurus vulpecula]|uniref:centrosomal protein of 131 kDa isoform X2 n=1 Tax=Trichosurus vulpecula TaxID=9337 RepID=UPI00186B4B8B|nr:centrosomal protein of 131 kDa isoform X2 [Trichosurus vulpecula]